jgi:hypothetical protein
MPRKLGGYPIDDDGIFCREEQKLFVAERTGHVAFLTERLPAGISFDRC